MTVFRITAAVAALIILVSVPSGANAGESVSLYDAWKLTLSNSESVLIAGEEAFQDRLDKHRAYSRILPSVTLSGNYTKYSEDKYSASGVLLQPEDTTRYEARVEQTIFGGGKEFSAIRQAGFLSKGSKAMHEDAKEDAIVKGSRAFYNLLASMRELDIRKSSLKRAEDLLTLSKKRFEVGSATKADVLRAEAEAAAKRADVVVADGAHVNAVSYFERLTALKGEYTLVPQMPGLVEWFKTVEDNADKLILTALEKRRDYKQLEYLERAASSGVGYARGQFLPTVSLEGVYVKRDQTPLPTEYIDEYVYGGINVKFPIFEGGLRVAELRQAKSKFREASLMRVSARRDIELDVRRKLNDMKSAMALVDSYEKALAFAKENYEVVLKQYRYGLADNIGLVEAETTLVGAELGFSRASLSYELSVIELKRSIGVLFDEVTVRLKLPVSER
ncbi:MAG: TolC family protein [Deltaproteobacteria bacterium]|nr:TolC family protein [Deltaproteobacteria bacterium]